MLSVQPPAITARTLAEQISAAYEQKSSLIITGGNSKAFYGRHTKGFELSIAGYSGILNYEPSELVITARAGTPLKEIEELLAEHGQMLGFEPPSFSDTATLGGTIACGISGPRRPYAGAVRDFVLGATIINGKGDILKFGGQVMKNVAGYDVSRLMTGALGTLGVLLDISLKVIPKPAVEETRILPYDHQQMSTLLSTLGRQPIPLSATYLHKNLLYVRFSGAKAGVVSAAENIGGDVLRQADLFWHQLKEQRLPYFNQDRSLWRVSLPPNAPCVPDLIVDTESVTEWGGAQRWVYPKDTNALQQWASDNGGHASYFRNRPDANNCQVSSNDTNGSSFSPLSPALLTLSKRIKHSFDPHNILNPGRLYADL
ncbi:glycolate oxidase subunit GlcE [Neptunomonas japonica]|uniref:Glycolate oxidase FAD binding subunit n=1 Tax=Neptunomonas japonica JAMM 1380 TaxID=1441457 RepID=A0A7R6SX33_9GAMM|nr:glycolate oxidase subunit GlcE [Neptunomonas japonica]BBB30272.1 glycolate oxidase FAD binding subunit [Neptunomonas japonica JAMM 1380]